MCVLCGVVVPVLVLNVSLMAICSTTRPPPARAEHVLSTLPTTLRHCGGERGAIPSRLNMTERLTLIPAQQPQHSGYFFSTGP
jgi:hypothetical protein